MLDPTHTRRARGPGPETRCAPHAARKQGSSRAINITRKGNTKRASVGGAYYMPLCQSTTAPPAVPPRRPPPPAPPERRTQTGQAVTRTPRCGTSKGLATRWTSKPASTLPCRRRSRRRCAPPLSRHTPCIETARKLPPTPQMGAETLVTTELLLAASSSARLGPSQPKEKDESTFIRPWTASQARGTPSPRRPPRPQPREGLREDCCYGRGMLVFQSRLQLKIDGPDGPLID